MGPVGQATSGGQSLTTSRRNGRICDLEMRWGPGPPHPEAANVWESKQVGDKSGMPGDALDSERF